MLEKGDTIQIVTPDITVQHCDAFLLTRIFFISLGDSVPFDNYIYLTGDASLTINGYQPFHSCHVEYFR